jgi:hypothetical protein
MNNQKKTGDQPLKKNDSAMATSMEMLQRASASIIDPPSLPAKPDSSA